MIEFLLYMEVLAPPGGASDLCRPLPVGSTVPVAVHSSPLIMLKRFLVKVPHVVYL